MPQFITKAQGCRKRPGWPGTQRETAAFVGTGPRPLRTSLPPLLPGESAPLRTNLQPSCCTYAPLPLFPSALAISAQSRVNRLALVYSPGQLSWPRQAGRGGLASEALPLRGSGGGSPAEQVLAVSALSAEEERPQPRSAFVLIKINRSVYSKPAYADIIAKGNSSKNQKHI